MYKSKFKALETKRSQAKFEHYLNQILSVLEPTGPHGCGNVLGRNVHICRRLIWTFILLFGLLYTFNVISINARKYFQFPSSLKPVLSNASNSTNSSIHYPSIVICHNSMHSDQLTKKIHPILPHLYPAFYNYSAPFPSNHPSQLLIRALEDNDRTELKRWQFLKQIDMTNYLKETASNVWIMYCKYHDEDCRKYWVYEVTLYGYCLRLRTNITKIDHRTAIARRSALTVYLGFNKTDGSHGWNNQLSGYTVFFNWMEDLESSYALDISQSFTAYENLMPIISMKMMETVLKNAPYTKCQPVNQISEDGKKQQFIPYATFDHYSEMLCNRNCLFEKLKSECKCRPVYIPAKHINLTTCDYFQHVWCAAPLIRSGDYHKDCHCLPGCEARQFSIDTIQYGEMKDFNTTKPGQALAGFQIYMTSSNMLYYFERPDYDKARFLSDIGGAAGLVLGMSIASILGFIDCLIIYLFKSLAYFLRRLRACLYRIIWRKMVDFYRHESNDKTMRVTLEKSDSFEKSEPSEEAEKPKSGSVERQNTTDSNHDYVSIELHQDMYIKRHVIRTSLGDTK